MISYYERFWNFTIFININLRCEYHSKNDCIYVSSGISKNPFGENRFRIVQRSCYTRTWSPDKPLSNVRVKTNFSHTFRRSLRVSSEIRLLRQSSLLRFYGRSLTNNGLRRTYWSWVYAVVVYCRDSIVKRYQCDRTGEDIVSSRGKKPSRVPFWTWIHSMYRHVDCSVLLKKKKKKTSKIVC